MTKVKILIVEDEVLIADHIAETLEELGYEVFEPAISYTEAVETIEQDMPDLAILDIQLSGRKSGVDLAQKINESYQFPFIFLTSNSDKGTLDQAKLVEPYAFLVKPYTKEELFASIELALYNFSKKMDKTLNQDNLIIKDALFIKTKQVFLRLNFNDILYLASDHVYIDIMMIDGKKHTVRGSLNDYRQKLGPSFIRSHRSYIINLNHLKGINHTVVFLNESEVPVGRRYREDLLEKLNVG